MNNKNEESIETRIKELLKKENNKPEYPEKSSNSLILAHTNQEYDYLINPETGDFTKSQYSYYSAIRAALKQTSFSENKN